MFNLLPPEHQHLLRKEYARRRFVLLLSALALLVFSALLTLFPAYLLSVEKEKEITLEERTAVLSYKDDVTAVNKDLVDLKGNTGIIKLNASKVKIYEVLAQVISSKSSEIKVKSLLYKKEKDKPILVSIVGVAETRDGLLSFARSLEKITLFSKVDVPVSNFAKDQNIDFSLELTEALEQ